MVRPRPARHDRSPQESVCGQAESQDAPRQRLRRSMGSRSQEVNPQSRHQDALSGRRIVHVPLLRGNRPTSHHPEDPLPRFHTHCRTKQQGNGETPERHVERDQSRVQKRQQEWPRNRRTCRWRHMRGRTQFQRRDAQILPAWQTLRPAPALHERPMGSL